MLTWWVNILSLPVFQNAFIFHFELARLVAKTMTWMNADTCISIQPCVCKLYSRQVFFSECENVVRQLLLMGTWQGLFQSVVIYLRIWRICYRGLWPSLLYFSVYLGHFFWGWIGEMCEFKLKIMLISSSGGPVFFKAIQS